MEQLKCSACGLLKLESEFSRNRHKVIYKGKEGKKSRQALHGRTYDCLICIQKKRKKYLNENPHMREKLNAQKRAYYHTPEFRQKARRHYYKKRYGITLEEYEQILEKQNAVCAICGESNNHKTQQHLHIDHNHKTGKVRGLLCIRCNTIIGNCKENADVLRKAIKYIFKHFDVT